MLEYKGLSDKDILDLMYLPLEIYLLSNLFLKTKGHYFFVINLSLVEFLARRTKKIKSVFEKNLDSYMSYLTIL